VTSRRALPAAGASQREEDSKGECYPIAGKKQDGNKL
jgi:hypothetical protein